MSNTTQPDGARYAEGRKAAERWIAGGGSLTADGPDSDEAYYNGFIDRLTEERRNQRT